MKHGGLVFSNGARAIIVNFTCFIEAPSSFKMDFWFLYHD